MGATGLPSVSRLRYDRQSRRWSLQQGRTIPLERVYGTCL